MGLLDAERIEKTEHCPCKLAERVLAVEAFGRPSVARHVGRDHTKSVGQPRDVARKVGQAGRAGPAAVQHEQRRAFAQFRDEYFSTSSLNRSAALWLDGRNGIHARFSLEKDAIAPDEDDMTLLSL